MKTKFFIISGLVVVLAFIGLIILAGRNSSDQNGNSAATGGAGQNIGDPININGWLVCLPAQLATSTACAIGIQTSAGQNYGLVNATDDALDPTQVTTGSSYTAIGNLINTPDFLKNYTIKGTIKLSQ
jgi:hypothetical protein